MEMVTTEKKQIESILKEILELPIDQDIDQNEDLTMLGLDSFKSISLVVELEMLFDIEFVDDELLLQNFSTIEKIINKVNGKKENDL